MRFKRGLGWEIDMKAMLRPGEISLSSDGTCPPGYRPRYADDIDADTVYVQAPQPIACVPINFDLPQYTEYVGIAMQPARDVFNASGAMPTAPARAYDASTLSMPSEGLIKNKMVIYIAAAFIIGMLLSRRS